MAKAASKKQAAQNAMMVRILTYGFLVSNLVHLLIVFGPLRDGKTGLTWPLVKFISTEAVAAVLGVTLRGMARQGDDLGQPGLTSYMFDIIYVTWFVHITTALFSSKFWYFYLVIPAYALFVAYTKVIVPFVFGGRDPFHSLLGLFSRSNLSADQTVDPALSQPAQSKRQAKLQKRAERGDSRVQTRQR